MVTVADSPGTCLLSAPTSEQTWLLSPGLGWLPRPPSPCSSGGLCVFVYRPVSPAGQGSCSILPQPLDLLGSQAQTELGFQNIRRAGK